MTDDDGPTTLLVFSDDWGRHPSSCQHLARHWMARHPVFWVNTIGTRSPRLDLASVQRALGKFRQWSRPRMTGPAANGPRVLEPRMWPWFRSRLDRRANRELLMRQLAPVVEASSGPVVAVTTIPIVADLVGKLPVARWVYYCVDDFGEWPGLDHGPLRAMEATLVRDADALIAVSEPLRHRLAAMGRGSRLLTHGTDVVLWADGGDGEAPPASVAGLERPLVVFWGVIDRRLDLAMLARLGADLVRGTIVLAGPESDPDPRLATVPRLARVGSIPFAGLPRLGREASVLIMPYDDLPVTRAMQPLKLKEYLATGKPVVARGLPACQEWSDGLDLVDTPEEFSAAVRRRVGGEIPASQAEARRRLRGESWESKAAKFERWSLGATLKAGGDDDP